MPLASSSEKFTNSSIGLYLDLRLTIVTYSGYDDIYSLEKSFYRYKIAFCKVLNFVIIDTIDKCA